MRSCGGALEGHPESSLESEMGPSSMQRVSGVNGCRNLGEWIKCEIMCVRE